MTSNLVDPTALKLNKPLVLSSRHIGWQGILVEQYQNSAVTCEAEVPALSTHWFSLPLGSPAHLIQKCGDRLHESTLQKGDSVFVPAGQPSYWCRQGSDVDCPVLHIHLKPKLIRQIAETSAIALDKIEFENCFSKQDLQLHYLAMLFLAELKSGSIMGQLYIESLTQMLVIHLLRKYSTCTPIATPKNKSLTRTQLQKAIAYIEAHLDRELSISQIAGAISLSPNYFASLFKRATGIPPHQYVIEQRVERAKLLLLKTDMEIANIALEVGFSSQSHLTRQFKRLTGTTPKQIRS